MQSYEYLGNIYRIAMVGGNVHETVNAQNDANVNTAAHENGDDMVVFEIVGATVENPVKNGSPFVQSPKPLDNNYHPPITTGSLPGDNWLDRSHTIRIPRHGLQYRLHSSQLWMMGLFEEFFHPCDRHAGYSGNECKFLSFSSFSQHSFDFSILCKHCLNDSNCFETCLQVRRYMYQNVILVEDLSELYCPSEIQAYTINGKRAVLINPRIPSPNAFVASVFKNFCFSCNVPLRSDCTFCSLSCKLWSHTSNEPLTPRSILRTDHGLRICTVFDPQMELTPHEISEIEGLGYYENATCCHNNLAAENCAEVRRRKGRPERSPDV